MSDGLLSKALPYLFYILGSLCFLAGSIISIGRMMR